MDKDIYKAFYEAVKRYHEMLDDSPVSFYTQVGRLVDEVIEDEAGADL